MQKGTSRFQTRILAETIVLAALSAVLYSVRPFTLPYGGSITLGSIVPIAWLSLRRGIRVGLVGGALFGLLALLIDVVLLGASSVVVTPVQVVLEYPIAFGVLGIAGIFRKKSIVSGEVGLGLSVLFRFFIHYVVGVFIWVYIYSFPAEWGQYLWPLVYNGSFLLVEFIVAAVVIAVLIRTKTLEYFI